MKSICKSNKQDGMTLIEIMVALALGAFLLTGVIQIFLGSTQSYRMLENQSRLQESGRFAMSFLTRDIRQAGFRCWPNAVIATPLAGTNNDGLNGADSITVRLASTCPGADIPITYTIATSNGQPSLFQNNNGTNQALIEGVENMQILYGEDSSGDNTPEYYVPAGTAGLTMSQVVSIRIGLLVVSLDNNLTSKPIAYTFNDVTTTPTDNRIRRVFSSTIAVRNLLP